MAHEHHPLNDLVHALYGVDAELSYVEAMLKMYMQKALSSGDSQTAERIQLLLAT
jgi:hypothetical protein